MIVRADVPAIFTLGGFAIVNLAITVVLVRGWARMLGYAPERTEVGPLLTGTVGGLRAAERVRTAS
jgi:hypothetical protein